MAIIGAGKPPEARRSEELIGSAEIRSRDFETRSYLLPDQEALEDKDERCWRFSVYVEICQQECWDLPNCLILSLQRWMEYSKIMSYQRS